MSEMRQPIYDPECEKLVLGTLLNNATAWNDNADLLEDGLFYDRKHNAMFKAAKRLRDRSEDVSFITVHAELQKDEANTVSINDVMEVTNHQHLFDVSPYVVRLVELNRRRRMLTIAHQAEQDAYNMGKPIDEAQASATDALGELFKTATTNIVSNADVGDDFMKNVIEANRNGNGAQIIPTGFASIDNRGFMPTDLMVIGADSSQGKTSFVTAILTHAARRGYAVAVYSMEMAAKQLYARMMATETGIPSNVLNLKPLDNAQLERVTSASESMRHLPIYFDERSTSTLDSILASIRTMVAKKRVKLVVVDYLQILNVNSTTANKEQMMGTAARLFKDIAKQLNIAVILLSQLSRNQASPRPTLARLRDSGQIAEAADIVILIYRPEAYDERYSDEFADVSTQGTAMIDVAKGRNVGTFRFIVGCEAQLTKFYDIPQDALPKIAQAQTTSYIPDDEELQW